MAREALGSRIVRVLRRLAALLAALGVLAITPAACRHADAPPTGTERPASTPAAQPEATSPRHDLSIDESLGGHTLARHVARTNAELARRLQRERIAAVSPYSAGDRA